MLRIWPEDMRVHKKVREIVGTEEFRQFLTLNILLEIVQ